MRRLRVWIRRAGLFRPAMPGVPLVKPGQGR